MRKNTRPVHLCTARAVVKPGKIREGVIRMGRKETYDFLLQPRSLSYDIWRKELRREELLSCLLPKAITYDSDKVQSSPADHVSEIMAEVDSLERQIADLKKRRAMVIVEISKSIDLLDDSRERMILDAYYLGRQSMIGISEQLHYSLQHTYRLRNSGERKMRKMRNASVV